MLSSQSLDDGGDRGQRDLDSKKPLHSYLVVVSLMHPNGPQVIFDRTAKVVMLIFFALRVAPSRVGMRSTGCRDREKPRTRVGWGKMGIGVEKTRGI